MNINRNAFLGSALAALLFPAANSQAAFVTTNEADMDLIFSQGTFGSTPIDIRFLPINVINNASLLDIDTAFKLNSLFSMNTDPSPTTNMFFVDTVDYCGSFSTSIVGCANTPGNSIVVESAVAGGANGAELNSHELGHNLNLPHVIFPNLMTATLNGNTDLTVNQVDTILTSALVQSDISGLFIEIRPILITAVPVPGALILLLSGLSALGFTGVRRRAR